MVWHVFHEKVALDSTTHDPVDTGSMTAHDVDDTSGVTPLAVTDLAGVPLPGDLIPVNRGLVAGFRVEDRTQVILRSGPHLIHVWSPDAMETSARDAADAAASAAPAAAQAAVDGVMGAIDTTVDDRMHATGYAPVLVVSSVDDVPVGTSFPAVLVIPGDPVDPVPAGDVTLRSWAVARSNQEIATANAVGAGAVDGDMLIAVIVAAAAGITWTPVNAGWVELVPATTMGTRTMVVFARPWSDSDPATFNFTQSTVAAKGCLTLALGGADVIGTWDVGAVGTRASTGTSTTNVAPAVSTDGPALVVTVSAEATNAADAAAPTVSGADLWAWSGEESGHIETITIATADQASAGATDPVTITYPNVQAANGAAVQIAVPAVNP